MVTVGSLSVNVAGFQFKVQRKVSAALFLPFLKSIESCEWLSSVSRHMAAFIQVLENILRLLCLFISAFFLSLFNSFHDPNEVKKGAKH